VSPVVAVPVLASMLLWVTGRRLGRLLPPALASRLLPVAALVTALATGLSLAVTALVVLGREQWLADLGHWSRSALRLDAPAPIAAGLIAAAVLAALAGAAVRQVARTGAALWAAEATCRRLPRSEGLMVIVDDADPDAYALPGLRGRIVVSTSMLRALPPDERPVLLAHERSHLAHRHYLWVQLAELAAAADPLLRPLAGATRLAVERWADEDAAREVGDRRLAARAIARAGLARSRTLAGPALAATGADIGTRIAALLGPPARHYRGVAAGLVAVVVVTAAASLITVDRTEGQFERAQAAYAAAGQRP
jgi:Zn-dependent protease with chaperone function